MAGAEGALRVALPAVSGAFYTPLMQTVQDNLKQASHKSAIPLCCVEHRHCRVLRSIQVANQRL